MLDKTSATTLTLKVKDTEHNVTLRSPIIDHLFNTTCAYLTKPCK